MKITKDLLKKYGACELGIQWFESQSDKTPSVLVNRGLESEKRSFINWAFSRILSKNNKIRYAIYSAKLALPFFEKRFPDDKRPRKAILAASRYLKNPSVKNQNAANVAADAAANAAANAANTAAYAAANAAANAANTAAYAAANTAAYAAANTASANAAANTAAAYAAANTAYRLIFKYGLKLLKRNR
jgi:hypothetical protein